LRCELRQQLGRRQFGERGFVERPVEDRARGRA
jgi:hypothetical protein